MITELQRDGVRVRLIKNLPLWLDTQCAELLKVATPGPADQLRCELVAGHAGGHWCGKWQW